MKIALLLLFALICFCLLYWGVCRIGRIYQFPFLAGGVFAGFVLPQLIGLVNDNSIPKGGLEKVILVCILCASMCYFGYVWDNRPMRCFDWTLSGRKLLLMSFLLSGVGGGFFLAIKRLPQELTVEVAQWTGLPVAYLFFAQLLSYGFIFSVLLFLTFRSKAALLIALICILFYLDRIIFLGRRAVALELFFSVLATIWFVRKYALPRWGMVLLIVAGAFLLFSTGEYRYAIMIFGEQGWEGFFALNPVEKIQAIIHSGGSEVRNAVYAIQAADITMDFDLGLFHWNTLVFNYVPAQLLGSDFKETLLLPISDDSFNIFGHIPWIGSTSTGMADSFKSFWYFGCVIFFLIAYVMRKLYESAIGGHQIAIIVYPIFVVYGLHSITHHTHFFFSPLLHMTVFLLPALAYSRVRIDRCN